MPEEHARLSPTPDTPLAAWSGTSRLLNLGHWNIGLLAGTDTTVAERRDGFTRALAEHDIEVDADLIVSADTSTRRVTKWGQRYPS